MGVNLYADDAKLYLFHKYSSDSDLMRTAIRGLENCSDDWLMSIAAVKCVTHYLG